MISQYNDLGIHPNNVFFEPTLAGKIHRIAALNLDFFIDDLLQVFQHSNFPKKTNFMHFSQDLPKTALTDE